MRLVEIRDLDGPNIFLLQPAIKLELEVTEADLAPRRDRRARHAAWSRWLPPTTSAPPAQPGWASCSAPPARPSTSAPGSSSRRCAGWRWRRPVTGRSPSVGSDDASLSALARLLAAAATGEDVDLPADCQSTARPAASASRRGSDDADDRPGMIRDEDRTIPVVAVTGTNGKTTTTRLIAHILRGVGRKVGWTSTVGVFIEGEMVLEGDYTGPAGAWRVLREPGLDIAVLETARGGILLRGMACQSNDVSVMINVSGDHLGLHGVQTVEGLAEVKGVVLRTTRPDGWVVLNADDPLVRAQAAGLHAPIIWVTQDPENPTVVAHRHAGGRAVIAEDGSMLEVRGEETHGLARLEEMPITFGGTARHMIENALCAAAATLALELDREAVGQGLRTFGADAGGQPRPAPRLRPQRGDGHPRLRAQRGGTAAPAGDWRAATERETAG